MVLHWTPETATNILIMSSQRSRLGAGPRVLIQVARSIVNQGPRQNEDCARHGGAVSLDAASYACDGALGSWARGLMTVAVLADIIFAGYSPTCPRAHVLYQAIDDLSSSATSANTRRGTLMKHSAVMMSGLRPDCGSIWWGLRRTAIHVVQTLKLDNLRRSYPARVVGSPAPDDA